MEAQGNRKVTLTTTKINATYASLALGRWTHPSQFKTQQQHYESTAITGLHHSTLPRLSARHADRAGKIIWGRSRITSKSVGKLRTEMSLFHPSSAPLSTRTTVSPNRGKVGGEVPGVAKYSHHECTKKQQV